VSGKKGKVELDDDEETSSVVDFPFYEREMEKHVTKMKEFFDTLRAGAISPSLLANVPIEVDGETVMLSNLANIFVKEPLSLTVQLHDEKLVTTVCNGLRKSDLELHPQPFGSQIKIPTPKVTKEFRDSLVNLASKRAEQTKISIRKVRKDGMDEIKKHKKTLNEETFHKSENKMQALTDAKIDRITSMLEAKQKEIFR